MCHLGVFFDRQLNFTEHVNKTLARANRGLHALRAASIGKERHLVMLFKSLVLSIVDYALPMIILHMNQLNRLERLQNIGLRNVT